MKVCFVASQLFIHGKYGGFGSLTRTLGKALVQRGVQVYAVTPRRPGQPEHEIVDGMEVLSHSPRRWSSAIACFRAADCDIYHSEEPTMGTYYAQRAMPGRIHLVTAQDPRDAWDWWTEFRYLSMRRRLTFPVWMAYENNPLVRRAVRSSTRCYVQAHFICDKVRHMYGLDYEPEFLPNPVKIPERPFEKSPAPLVVFLARWDRRKRVERFLELAPQFPGVRFVAVGKAHEEAYDRNLRTRFGGIPNLEMPGFVDQFAGGSLSDYLGPAWVMCNPAARECLPVAYLEAAAHQCAILSYTDPDGFASQMGYHASDGDFAKGLAWLLEKENWRRQGMKGYEYVNTHHALDHAVEQHLAVYKRHLQQHPH